jgi:nitrate/nitrite transport system substrate-binding protein
MVQCATRRSVLRLSSAALTLASAKAAFPGGAFAQSAVPEVKGTRLGYIALTDASPLVIAKVKGLFAKYGVPDMEVAK